MGMTPEQRAFSLNEYRYVSPDRFREEAARHIGEAVVQATAANVAAIERLKALCRSAQNTGAEANNEIARLRKEVARLQTDLPIRHQEPEIERLRREAAEACVNGVRNYWLSGPDIGRWHASGGDAMVAAVRSLDAAVAKSASESEREAAVGEAMNVLQPQPRGLFEDRTRESLYTLHDKGMLRRAEGGAR